MKTAKPGLDSLIEARLQATDNWPQPSWVIAALTQELETEVQELVNRKVDADTVRKIYRRKSAPPRGQIAAVAGEPSRARVTSARDVA